MVRLAGRPRPRRADGLALRRAMPDRLLPALVAAMTFLAALALAGAVGAALLAQRWNNGAAAILTVQVPDGDAASPGGGTRLVAALGVLSRDPAIAEAKPLDPARLSALLAPWLGAGAAGGAAGNSPGADGDDESRTHRGATADGQAGDQAGGPAGGGTTDRTGSQMVGATDSRAGTGDASADRGGGTAMPAPAPIPALSLPSVIQARLRPGVPAPSALAGRLEAAAPGTLLDRNQGWTEQLVALTTSLQACAGVALLVVAGVAVAVVAAATRAGLAARRHSIEIVHGLGAGDGYIAGRFARRTTGLAFSGGIAGTLLSIPLLLLLCRLGAPFAGEQAGPATLLSAGDGGGPAGWIGGALPRVPLPLWIALPLLPPVAASIGWLTAQATVRAWLRRLP